MLNFDSDIRFGLPGVTKIICKGRVDTAGEVRRAVIAINYNISSRGLSVVKGS
jgi:hypothetical protein